MLFHEAIARTLRDLGITTIFGVMGDANMFMLDSFSRHAGGDFLATASESGAVLAANGYAKVTGTVGAACVTHGAAVTNTVTALVESVRDRTPLILIAGDTAVTDKFNFQNIAQREIVLPTGAGFEQLRSPDTMQADVAEAIRRARVERRPIVLNVPADFQWQEVDDVASRQAIPPNPRAAPAQEALQQAVEVIAAARRPLVLAGRGAADDDARARMVQLAARLGAPLATTLLARDLFRSEPHNLGVCGGLANELAARTIGEADCLIAFGASLNKWTTFEQTLVAGKAVIQVDDDPAAFGRFCPVDVAVLGDAGTTAGALTTLLDARGHEPTGFASDELAELLARRSDADFVDMSTDTTVDHRTAILRIDGALDRERLLVMDAGRFAMHCFQYFHVAHPRDYVHTLNSGSIGLAMGNANGAAVGSGRPVLVVTGDGGFMLGGIGEFNTAVRLGLDIVVVLFNDSAYGAEYIQFQDRGLDPSLTRFDWPDFAPVADALGGKGYTVRNLDELDSVLAELPGRDRPVLIDVKLDPERVSMLPIGH